MNAFNQKQNYFFLYHGTLIKESCNEHIFVTKSFIKLSNKTTY